MNHIVEDQIRAIDASIDNLIKQKEKSLKEIQNFRE